MRNSQPVNRCHPLIQPPLSLLLGPSVHPTDHSAEWRRAISWVPGVLLPLLPDGRQAGGRWGEGEQGMGEVSMGARWNHSRAANRRVACRPAKAVATSRPKLSTQPRPELRPQAGPEVRREPTRSPKLARLCWCAARSIEAMHAPAVELHHLAAQFYLTLAPTRHSTQLRPGPAFEIAHGADYSRTRPAPDLHQT